MRQLLIALSAALLIACSGAPSTGAAEKMVAEHMQKGATLFEVDSATKTNGILKDEQNYEGDFDIALTFNRDLSSLREEVSSKKGGNPIEAMQELAMLAGLVMLFGEFKAGDEKVVKMKVQFLKKEKGWEISDMAPIT